MRLQHVTNKAGAVYIKAHGFAPDVSSDSDRSWFVADLVEFFQTSEGRRLIDSEPWLVVVEFPDEVASRFRHDDDEHGSMKFLIPWSVVNAYPPLEFRSVPQAR